RNRYEQLLEEYPDSEYADAARKGLKRANRAIRLQEVENSINSGTYCQDPMKYEGAPAPRKGLNKSQFLNNEDYSEQFPGRWRAPSTEKTVLIVCLGAAKRGEAVRTCPYRSYADGKNFSVTFHKIAVPVEVFELRTGKRVRKKTVQISGSSCPETIRFDYVPPSHLDVVPSEADVRRAFKPLIT